MSPYRAYRAYRERIEVIRRAIESCEAARSLYSAEAEAIAVAVDAALERAGPQREFYDALESGGFTNE